MVKTGIVLLALPFSMVGAVWFLYLAGFNLSVAVWVGIIALLGVDAETGVVMLLYLDLAYEKFKKNGLLKSMALNFGCWMVTTLPTLPNLKLPVMAIGIQTLAN